MTNEERLNYFESGRLGKKVKIALLDWLGGKASSGIESITDPLTHYQTELAIQMCLVDIEDMTRKLASLMVSSQTVKTAANEEAVTDAKIATAVNTMMADRIAWVTGIHALPESE